MVFQAAITSMMVALSGTDGQERLPNGEVQLPSRTAVNSQAVDASFLQPLEQENSNGRVWIGRPIIGGVENPLRDTRQDGAARYGAYGEGAQTIVVRVDGLFHFESGHIAEVRAFEAVSDQRDVQNPYSNAFSNGRKKIAARLEDARQQWLKDNNFVGGVRTFVNDASLVTPRVGLKTQPSGMPEPRGVIELAPDMPRLRSRMKVQGRPAEVVPHRVARASDVIKVCPKSGAPDPASIPGAGNHEVPTASATQDAPATGNAAKS